MRWSSQEDIGVVEAFFGDFPIWISSLSIAASISSIAQVILMIAEMRSKNGEKKTSSKPKTNKKTQGKGDGIKEIKVQMSDGSQVTIDSWLNDLEKVKRFLEIFGSPSASPKPEKVLFTLKNGSRLAVTISNDPESKEDLDALIKYFKSE